MRFFQTLLSGAAMIAAVVGITIDSYPSGGIAAGATTNITFTATGPCTLLLRKGPSNNLVTVATLTTTATGGSYLWTVASNLVSGTDYALQIVQGDQNNYSGQFSISGGTGVASSSAASASASASASMSSAMSKASSSASASVTKASNSTVSSATLSRSASSAAATSAKATGATTTSSGGPPQNTNAAAALVASPLTVIVGAFAAFAYLA